MKILCQLPSGREVGLALKEETTTRVIADTAPAAQSTDMCLQGSLMHICAMQGPTVSYDQVINTEEGHYTILIS